MYSSHFIIFHLHITFVSYSLLFFPVAPSKSQKEPSRSRNSKTVDAKEKLPEEKFQTRQISESETKSERKSKKDEKQSKEEMKVKRMQPRQKSPPGHSQPQMQNGDIEAHGRC